MEVFRFGYTGLTMIKTNIERRYWLIELFANWEGGVNSGYLQHYCQLGRQQASKTISCYQNDYPGQLDYCSSEKVFLPSATFTPHFISEEVAEYLNWMSGQQTYQFEKAGKYHVDTAVMMTPARLVKPVIMRSLVQALRQKMRIEINYISVSNPNYEGRIIVPVRFVNTGQRWHLRAWCEKAQAYRDFVLSRFQGTPVMEGKWLTSLPEDTHWNTHLMLCIQPDPRLTPAQQAVLEHDYGMKKGELKIKVRAALAHYLLQEMQVNVKMLDGNPTAQQLILTNYQEIQPWLFG